MPRKLLRNVGRHFVSTIGSMFGEVLVSWLPGYQWQAVFWFPPGCRTQKWHEGHGVHSAADSLTFVYSCSGSKHVGIFAASGVKVKTFHYLDVSPQPSHNLKSQTSARNDCLSPGNARWQMRSCKQMSSQHKSYQHTSEEIYCTYRTLMNPASYTRP